MGVDCFQFRILHKRGIDAGAFPWADAETITAARVAGSAGLGSGAGIKKAAEIVQICFAPSLPHLLQLSVSLASSLQLSLSVVQIMQGRRQRSRVRGCSSLRLASSFSVPLPLLGLGRLCFLCPSFLSVCLSVPLVLGAMRSRQAGAALRGMGGGWFDASRPDDPDCMGLYGLHNFRCPVLYSLTMGNL